MSEKSKRSAPMFWVAGCLALFAVGLCVLVPLGLLFFRQATVVELHRAQEAALRAEQRLVERKMERAVLEAGAAVEPRSRLEFRPELSAAAEAGGPAEAFPYGGESLLLGLPLHGCPVRDAWLQAGESGGTELGVQLFQEDREALETALGPGSPGRPVAVLRDGRVVARTTAGDLSGGALALPAPGSLREALEALGDLNAPWSSLAGEER